MQIFTQGLLLQASLILALGAQNLFVIDVGLKRNNHFLAATICAICDVLLISIGIFGVSGLVVSSPLVKIIIGGVGTLFLIFFCLIKLKEVIMGISQNNKVNRGLFTKKQIILATLSFTLLNPHVYLETVFLIGGYSTRFPVMTEKLLFWGGAGFFSVIWFYFLAGFSSRFSNLLSNERNMRICSFITFIVLSYLAIRLGQDSYNELQMYVHSI